MPATNCFDHEVGGGGERDYGLTDIEHDMEETREPDEKGRNFVEGKIEHGEHADCDSLSVE